jgi:hypothetical protein
MTPFERKYQNSREETCVILSNRNFGRLSGQVLQVYRILRAVPIVANLHIYDDRCSPRAILSAVYVADANGATRVHDLRSLENNMTNVAVDHQICAEKRGVKRDLCMLDLLWRMFLRT